MAIDQLKGIRRALWDWHPAGWVFRAIAHAIRAMDALIVVLLEGALSLRAMSLVYTTLLSLVPFLALGFSLLKAFGIHNQLEPVLLESLKALGPTQAAEVTRNIVSFVGNLNVGLLGSVGVGLLIYSAISLIQKVEEAFNYIWRVKPPRGITTRLAEYLAVMTLGPLVMFSVLGSTASAFNNDLFNTVIEVPVLGFIVYLLSAAVPYVLITLLFSFLYGFLPYTRVRFKSAALGGLVAGFMWQTASYAFASFVATATNYNAVYSGFAIVIFVLIWLQLGWLILLCGCQLAYFAQHPERMSPYAATAQPMGRAREQLGMALMLHITRAFTSGAPAPSRKQLASLLGINETAVVALAQPMIGEGLLLDAGEQWVPARDPAELPMGELWRLLRGSAANADSTNNSADYTLVRAAAWLDQAESAGVASNTVSLKEYAAGSA